MVLRTGSSAACFGDYYLLLRLPIQHTLLFPTPSIPFSSISITFSRSFVYDFMLWLGGLINVGGYGLIIIYYFPLYLSMSKREIQEKELKNVLSKDIGAKNPVFATEHIS